jgi:acyl-coenzyme A thioesterase PaaI-like protein
VLENGAMSLADQILGDQPVKTLWDRLSPLPGGRAAFSRSIGLIAPYSASIGATVKDLGPGRARVTLKERRRLHNPFNSVHAIALANLGELATGLAMMYDFPADARGIVTKFEITFHKKARGLITAICHTDLVDSSDERPVEVSCDIRDEAGDLVARATATWLIRPKS